MPDLIGWTAHALQAVQPDRIMWFWQFVFLFDAFLLPTFLYSFLRASSSIDFNKVTSPKFRFSAIHSVNNYGVDLTQLTKGTFLYP